MNGLTVFDIQAAVAVRFNISYMNLTGRGKDKDCVLPRHIAMYLCRALLDLSHSEIGRIFHRDHTTVGDAVRSIRRILEKPSEKGEKRVRATIQTLLWELRPSGDAPQAGFMMALPG